MSLAPSEQRALTEIENSLKGSDPGLAEMMADFNQMASPAALPRWESLYPWRSRLKDLLPAAVATVVLGLLIFGFAFLANVSRSSARGAGCVLAPQVTSCQQARNHQSRRSQQGQAGQAQGHAQQAHHRAGGSTAAGPVAAPSRR